MSSCFKHLIFFTSKIIVHIYFSYFMYCNLLYLTMYLFSRFTSDCSKLQLASSYAMLHLQRMETARTCHQDCHPLILVEAWSIIHLFTFIVVVCEWVSSTSHSSFFFLCLAPYSLWWWLILSKWGGELLISCHYFQMRFNSSLGF